MKTVDKKKSFELPKEFAEKWLSALRSDEFNQTTSVLLHLDYEWDDENDEEDYDSPIEGSECYCCLGVAARICGVDFSNLAGRELMDEDPDFFQDKGVPVILTESSNHVTYSMVDVLTSLNDEFTQDYYNKSLKAFPNLIFRKKLNFEEERIIRFSFKEIADFIEDNTNFV